MNGLLYRATARMRGTDQPEVHAFFEAPPLTSPEGELQLLLSVLWRQPFGAIQIENVVEEDDHFRHWAVGHASTGDARLFELGVGDGGRIEYCTPSRTLLLVSPPVLQRLAKAQQAAEQLACAGYTVERQQAAA